MGEQKNRIIIGEYDVQFENGNVKKYQVIESYSTFEKVQSYDRYKDMMVTEEIESYVSDCDPQRGIISNMSPMGEALIKSEKGQTIIVNGKKVLVLNVKRIK